ncbi:hypothetical protein BGZ60DRAFT_269953 [Tricladium varicosporioides]|nr:hypothetical protein BGZ60DRAFT_269953 [Hymenoscyphus varicosporioides]
MTTPVSVANGSDHVSQSNFSILHDQITTIFQTNGPLPPFQQNCIGNLSNHPLLQQPLHAVASAGYQHTPNDQATFLAFFDDIQTNEFSTIPLPHQSSYSEDFLNHTLSGRSADAAAYPQYSYPANNQHSPLADHDNILRLPPSSHLNYPGYFLNHTLLEQGGIDSQCLYSVNDPQNTPIDLGNAYQPSPPSQSSWCRFLENDPLIQNFGQSSIIIPLSLAFTEYQDPAQNFQQYPLPRPLQPNTKHPSRSPSAGMAFVKPSLALNRRQIPCIGCRLRKIKCQKTSRTRESRCERCVKQHIPRQVCLRLRVTDYKIFEK